MVQTDGIEVERLMTGNVKVQGLDSIGRRMKRRLSKVENLVELNHEFADYCLGKRLKNMWKNSGRILGPYGKGTTKWARNAPATVKKKGFNKPLFSSRGSYGSSILMHGYNFKTWWGRRPEGAVANYKLWADRRREGVNYSAVLHYGSSAKNIPARPHHGFVAGDAKWLVERAAKRALHLVIS